MRQLIRGLLLGALALAIVALPGLTRDATAEDPGPQLGTTYRTLWYVPGGGSLGEAEAVPSISATGAYTVRRMIVLTEFGTGAETGNQFAGLWAGFLHRDGPYVGVGLDSRYILDEAGAGPSAVLGALLGEGTRLNVQMRYSWWGRDNGATVSLGFGYLVGI
jgi:hypothetical protein